MPDAPDTVTLTGPPPVTVELRASARARRLWLRVSGLDGRATLSVPRGVARGQALQFLYAREDWLRAALARAPSHRSVAPGLDLPVDGHPRRVVAAPRGNAVRLDGDTLHVPADRPAGAQLAGFLKTRARDALVPMAWAHAARLDRPVAAVALRDTRSRWGSCSAQGRLMFSWRLAMAPPAVQDYVAAHEAAHLVHMDHSRAFWRCVAALMPDYATHRAWLRAQGTGLHAYRFDNG